LFYWRNPLHDIADSPANDFEYPAIVGFLWLTDWPSEYKM